MQINAGMKASLESWNDRNRSLREQAERLQRESAEQKKRDELRVYRERHLLDSSGTAIQTGTGVSVGLEGR